MSKSISGERNIMFKKVKATTIPDLSDEGIRDWYSYQPKSDYRELVSFRRLPNEYVVELRLEWL